MRFEITAGFNWGNKCQTPLKQPCTAYLWDHRQLIPDLHRERALWSMSLSSIVYSSGAILIQLPFLPAIKMICWIYPARLLA